MYKVTFSNGWSTRGFCKTKNDLHAACKARESYNCWYEDEPVIISVEWTEIPELKGYV